MTAVRCYLPLDASALASLDRGDSVEGPLAAFTVTDELRRSDPQGDEEDWEDAALQLAVDACRAAGSPVVVGAADLPRELLAPSSDGGTLAAAHLERARLASLHLGDDVVTGDPASLPGPDSDVELSWYDVTELGSVLQLLAASAPTD